MELKEFYSVLILVLVIGLLAGVVSSALSAWIFEDEHATEYRKVIPHLAIKTVSETTINCSRLL